MAVRNVSLKDEAYNRLRSARRYPGESFSEVVLRATWPEDTITAAAFLNVLRTRREHFELAELDRIDVIKSAGGAAEDKWAER